jgi:parallel beta-helix repeat protein
MVSGNFKYNLSRLIMCLHMKKRKILPLISLILLLATAMFSHLQPSAAARTTINILTDGQINPPNVSIQRSGNLYFFTGNVSDEIVVEKDNIILDGDGYVLEGSGEGTGISLCGRANVTVKNTQIRNFAYGVSFGGLGCFSSYNSIINNSITQNTCDGLYLDYYSNYNNITGNIIAENNNGVYLYCSSNNNIARNNIIANSYEGISLSYSSNDNTITENNIAYSWYGVTLEHVTNNKFYQNNFVENVYQVHSSGYGNTWDNGKLGNYWSDYNGSDDNNDGVGDTPCVIDAGNTCQFPLTSKLSNYPQYLQQSTETPNQPDQEQPTPTPTATVTPPAQTGQPLKASPEPSNTIPEENTGASPTAEPTNATSAEQITRATFPWILSVVALVIGSLFLWRTLSLLGKHRNNR